MDGGFELLVFHVSVQKLVDNVHDIGKAGDLADLLEAILGHLAPLQLFEGDLLQAVPRELLHRVDLPIPACCHLEGLVGSLHSYLIAPPLKVLTVPHLVLPHLRGCLEIHERVSADCPLDFDLLLHRLKPVDASDLLFVHAPTVVLPPLHLCGLAPEVILHDVHLVLHELQLALQPCNHVLVHLLRLDSLVYLGRGPFHPGEHGLTGHAVAHVGHWLTCSL
mmetsp:Transcript_17583/g.55661  ORF Transcript_17583/g.55661 Transcript_17583/m.55661 type:complete len:221 (+) Transcript_17583:846-1508(+)